VAIVMHCNLKSPDVTPVIDDSTHFPRFCSACWGNVYQISGTYAQHCRLQISCFGAKIGTKLRTL